MGAGCNRGLEVARGEYAFLLNNDVEVAEGWLEPLLAAMRDDLKLGACQPKVRSLRDRARFDYGGAAGGMMDRYGYTFCLGRLFDTVEEDCAQYDEPREIFWGMGGALFLRMACLERVGYVDEAYHMHMEEIDLCWRIRLAGYRIFSVPASVVYHYGGWSLESDSFRKAYLNHRNQLVMVLKNLSAGRLVWVFPARVCLELATLLLGIVRGDWKHPAASLAALAWVATHTGEIRCRRRNSQAVKAADDSEVYGVVYPGSVAAQYFLRRVRTAQDLPGYRSLGKAGPG
jgi:GT2 family glycosyltransferase